MGLNSVATIEIIVGLEEEFGIEVVDEDLRLELFESVRTMAEYVRSALSARPEEIRRRSLEKNSAINFPLKTAKK